MAQLAMLLAEATATDQTAIDCVHLKQMTFGDRGLERELLQLFDRQGEIMIMRMSGADAASVGVLAHTLKGSARGIGAGRVASAAEAAEIAAAGEPAALRPALDRLAEAVAEARCAIAALLSEG